MKTKKLAVQEPRIVTIQEKVISTMFQLNYELKSGQETRDKLIKRLQDRGRGMVREFAWLEGPEERLWQAEWFEFFADRLMEDLHLTELPTTEEGMSAIPAPVLIDLIRRFKEEMANRLLGDYDRNEPRKVTGTSRAHQAFVSWYNWLTKEEK